MLKIASSILFSQPYIFPVLMAIPCVKTYFWQIPGVFPVWKNKLPNSLCRGNFDVTLHDIEIFEDWSVHIAQHRYKMVSVELCSVFILHRDRHQQIPIGFCTYFNTARKRSGAKVKFSQVSVSHSVHGEWGVRNIICINGIGHMAGYPSPSRHRN